MLRLPQLHMTLEGLQDNTKYLEIYSKVVRFHHGDYKGNVPFKTSDVQKKKKPNQKSKLSCSYPISFNSALPAFVGFQPHFPCYRRTGEKLGIGHPPGLFHPCYLWVLPLDRCSSVFLSSLCWKAEAFCTVPVQRTPGWMGWGTDMARTEGRRCWDIWDSHLTTGKALFPLASFLGPPNEVKAGVSHLACSSNREQPLQTLVFHWPYEIG